MGGISQNLKAVITFGGNLDNSWKRSADGLQKSLKDVGKQSERLTKDQTRLAAEIKRAKLAGESLGDLKRRYTDVSREIRKTEAEQQKLNVQMQKAQRIQAFKGAGKGLFRRGLGIAGQVGGMFGSGLATGGVDGAGFNGNNMNVKSWDGIGFQNAADLVIRAYISTKLGIIAASESVYAGSANLYKNGDVYGDKWSTGNGPNWLSLFLEHLDSQIRNELTTWTTNNFPTKSDVSAALSLKPGRQYITQIGVYQNDKSKPFMLHDDDSGIFLAPSSSVHLDANGWHRDASTGLITQWGSGNVAGGQQQRVNFPMTFPNTCVTVVANDIGSGTLALSTISKDTGGFTVKGSSTIFGFNWLSMGY
ncbi:hypothetical protein B7D85_003885 [Salmonella enterica subsp. enterica serovar Bredeney]|nr:hypothetical protein [Salmonella enterica subsp. enterica serovar Bredeney]